MKWIGFTKCFCILWMCDEFSRKGAQTQTISFWTVLDQKSSREVKIIQSTGNFSVVVSLVHQC